MNKVMIFTLGRDGYIASLKEQWRQGAIDCSYLAMHDAINKLEDIMTEEEYKLWLNTEEYDDNGHQLNS